MLPALLLTAALCGAPANPQAPLPVPGVAILTETVSGQDPGGFTLNPWTAFKRDLRDNACQQIADTVGQLRTDISTQDLGATLYLHDLWVWGRDILLSAGIFSLAIVASAAAGIWPGLNRYAASAILPRVVLTVALLAAGPELLSLITHASNDLVATTFRHLPQGFTTNQLVTMAASLPLVLEPAVIVSSIIIDLLSVVRSFLLALFVTAGPFGIACHLWPGIDRWAKTWWRSIAILAVVVPLAQVLLTGLLIETVVNLSVNVVSPTPWTQAAIVLVAVAFQALVPLGLMIFALRPVHSQMGVAQGRRIWRSIGTSIPTSAPVGR